MTVLKNDSGTSWVNQPGRNESFFDALGFTNAGNGHKVVDVARTFLRGADSSCFILNGPVALPHPSVIAGDPRHLVRRRNGDLILSILVVCVWPAAHVVPGHTSSTNVSMLVLHQYHLSRDFNVTPIFDTVVRRVSRVSSALCMCGKGSSLSVFASYPFALHSWGRRFLFCL